MTFLKKSEVLRMCSKRPEVAAASVLADGVPFPLTEFLLLTTLFFFFVLSFVKALTIFLATVSDTEPISTQFPTP